MTATRHGLRGRRGRRGLPLLGVACFFAGVLGLPAELGNGSGEVAAASGSMPGAVHIPGVREFVDQYCIECHDREVAKGDLNLEAVRSEDSAAPAQLWERVVRRLRLRQMPPPGNTRPDPATYVRVLESLERSLDAAADRNPDPGPTPAIRRLNRIEYQNAIRDLLGLPVDGATLLPKEDAGYGFDTVTAATLSPTLLDRYLGAALRISRLAIGGPQPVGEQVFRLPADLTQEDPVEGLPLGTRGGARMPHFFPRDARYEIQVRLTRDRNEEIEGLREPHRMEVLLDGRSVAAFVVEPPRGHRDFESVDRPLRVRIPVTAGPHEIGVTFLKNPSSLLETRRQPGAARFNMHRHPRLSPAVYQVTIAGPYDSTGPGATPSREILFRHYPSRPEEEEESARLNLTALALRAYQRPVTAADLEEPMRLYREACRDQGFEAGMEAGLSAILMGPSFLFRVEGSPGKGTPGGIRRVTDLELARRLSFFLWSSIPDEELLDLAVRERLHLPPVLDAQTRRMLADPRAAALSEHFAEQWLHLRNLDAVAPDLRRFPDFDDNLRQAFREESRHLFQAVLQEDRSVRDLLRPGHAFLNERLARHYGVPHVQGSRFRRVDLPGGERGGLLRQGGILAVTSYADRTSPVLRGKWILENLLGTPPPPPPPDVPNLPGNPVSGRLSVRERLAAHRAQPGCAGCHERLDPPGFALEHFDAVGRWRLLEEGRPVDATGGWTDGSTFEGVAGLEERLLSQPEVLAGTLTEKLLIFALGRGLEPCDAPAVRRIVREAAPQDYRLTSLITGITRSVPFTWRRTE